MEEYKDASLKTKKQLHSIGTIRHVGFIRTSKSQPYAFEVVMKEKTPLLLACENQILMEEWISAFMEVMNSSKEEEEEVKHISHIPLEKKRSSPGKICFLHICKAFFLFLLFVYKFD